VNRAISDATQLAPFAQSSEDSRGRRYPEPQHDYRSPYQRDRDRIVHSRAFRRLEYKTQVFVNHESDHYRTRLTHTIEVSQIGRTVARALRINEDLVESLALSHDLGHTPFGHLGEDVLDELLAAEGGFNHNRQSLRIVEHLEDRYADFPGLNLTWEVREGIAKHSGPIDTSLAPEFQEYRPDLQPPLEAQLIDLVDEIAYNHHDVDDGLDSGLIDVKDLASDVSLFGEPLTRAQREHSGATDRQLHTAALRGMIDRLVSDLIATTRDRVERSGVATVDDVRQHGEQLVGLSEDASAGNAVLKVFLRDKLYHHQRIERTKDESRRMLRALFTYYMENEHILPADAQLRAAREGRARAVADHIAGMTDRYASDEHRRLFDPATSA
jgi:dGTPase